MTAYKAPLQDMRFILHDVLDSTAHFARLGRDDLTAEIVDAVGPSLVNALIRARSASKQQPSLRFSQIVDGLGFTAREAEVADLLVLGLTDDEICEKLGFSKPTLRSHIAAIFRKSGLNRRTQLAQYLAEKNHHL